MQQLKTTRPIDRLLDRLHKQALEYAVTTGANAETAASYEIGLLTGHLREMQSKIDKYVGETTHQGYYTHCYAGDAEFLVEYEYQRAEPAVYNLDSPMCGPGYPASCEIIAVLINGEWCDPASVIKADVIDRWADEICTQCEEDGA